ncbi:unnamed protein product [Adineta steineri]|uniref:CAP-Gly domain-containing protein n=1 Tax=Adineta steineri TaxID=433720 RepID=A0A814WHR6_9BILA|nr:unnamed protein product [Adineta steineri]CAF1385878.1 unnamed protein product [Adineta steineri]
MSKIPTNRPSLPAIKPFVRQRPKSPTSQQTNPTGNDRSNNPFRLADRVTTSGKSGVVAYIGPTQFAEGEWIGIMLDEAQGKNDGSYGDVRYFKTEANRGLFCRADKVQLLLSIDTPQQTPPYNKSRISFIEEERVNTPSKHPPSDTLDAYIKDLQIGDSVSIRGTKFGTLKYIGKIHVNEGIWCGIKLDGPLGKHNGKIEGVRYFRCSHRYGIFAPLRHVEKVVVDSKEPRRPDQDSPSPDSDLSEHSDSSINSNHFPPRSPTKKSNESADFIARESALSTQISDLLKKIEEKDNIIEKLQQKNNKYHSELSNTTEKMNDLEINILALQQQHDIKENENENLTIQGLELAQRLEDLQFQLEEYQHPESNQDHFKIPDDHRLLSPNEIFTYEKTKEKLTELQSINENLLHEKQIYQEELKRHNELIAQEKITTNLIDELRKEIKLLRSQLSDLQMQEQYTTSQLTEKEIFYKQQIKDYELKINQITKEAQNVFSDLYPGPGRKVSKMTITFEGMDSYSNPFRVFIGALHSANGPEDNWNPRPTPIQLRLTSLEQEKETNDKRINDLLNELKRHKENIVPDLEKQCQILKLELQNRDRTANMALSERETYFEQQIKEYQHNIHQATRETENIRTELKHIQEESDLKESKANLLINELKSNYEKIQMELNDREHLVNTVSNQHDSLYEQQIKEYENNLEEATRQTDNIKAELAKLEEDKVLHEQKCNNIVDSLKQDHERQYEILNTQLVTIQHNDNTQNIILNERIAHYEIEIKEYQIKIDQDAREIQNLRVELIKIQEENTSHEQQLKNIIDTLKKDLAKLQNELNDREYQANMTLQEYELKYKEQTEEYKNNLEHTNEQIQNLQTELENLQKEKALNEKQLNDTIDQLKQDYEIYKTDVEKRDQTQNITLSEREIYYQTEIKEYQMKNDQFLIEIQDLQTKLSQLHDEKTTNETQLNENINKLKQDHEVQYKELQIEIDELNEREHKVHKELHQRESHFDQQITEYQDKLEQANLKIQHIHDKLIKSEEEKTKSNDIITSLQHDLDTLKTELQNQDRSQNMALNERETQYQSQIKDYQIKRDESVLEIQSLQSELAKLQEEKATNDNKLNKTINTIQQDFEKLQNELAERERKEKNILKQCELQYEQQIDEYQKNLELSIIQNQNIQSELANLQGEKQSNEKNLNEIMSSLNEDFNEQIEILKTQNIELQENFNAKNNELTQKVQEINEYQTKFEQFNEQIVELNQQNEVKINQLQQLKSELDQKNQANKQITNMKQQYEQTQDELHQRTENLTTINETFKKEVEKLKEQNEQLVKNATDNNNKKNNETTENQDMIDQLTKQVNDLQQMYTGLLEKKADEEQKSIEEKKIQEKISKEKIGEYEMRIALMKSEYMVDMENTRLDHDQEILRLKTKLQEAIAASTTKPKGKK